MAKNVRKMDRDKAKQKDKQTLEELKDKTAYRSRKNKVIAGVCAGVADYYNSDPLTIRLVWFVFCLMGGMGVIAYILAWIFIPWEPETGAARAESAKTNASGRGSH